jgi:hypothetical protein
METTAGKPDASEGDPSLSDEAISREAVRLSGITATNGRLDAIDRSLRATRNKAYRFVRAESEGRIRALESVGSEMVENLRTVRLRLEEICVTLGLDPEANNTGEILTAMLHAWSSDKEKLHASESRVQALDGQIAEMLSRAGVS